VTPVAARIIMAVIVVLFIWFFMVSGSAQHRKKSFLCRTLAITWPQGPLQLQANIGGGSGEWLC